MKHKLEDFEISSTCHSERSSVPFSYFDVDIGNIFESDRREIREMLFLSRRICRFLWNKGEIAHRRRDILRLFLSRRAQLDIPVCALFSDRSPRKYPPRAYLVIAKLQRSFGTKMKTSLLRIDLTIRCPRACL